MTGWSLPVSVTVCGQSFAIRSDFRAVLDALAALHDEALAEWERSEAFLRILYPQWRSMPDAAAAFAAAMQFVNLGRAVPENQPPRPTLVDWEKDAELIAPGVDKVLGYSCRRCEYLHWWEFIGAYTQIGRGPFAEVINIRSKRAHGKALEKWEQQYARENAELVALPGQKLTSEEREFFRRLGLE